MRVKNFLPLLEATGNGCVHEGVRSRPRQRVVPQFLMAVRMCVWEYRQGNDKVGFMARVVILVTMRKSEGYVAIDEVLSCV